METFSKTKMITTHIRAAALSVRIAFLGLCMGISPVLTVHADPSEESSSDLGVGQIDVEDIIKSGKSLNESSLSKLGEKVDDIGGGSYNLFFKAGTYIIVVGTIAAGIGLVVAGAPKREEAKAKIGYIIAGSLLIFGAIAIAATLQKLGTGLFDI